MFACNVKQLQRHAVWVGWVLILIMGWIAVGTVASAAGAVEVAEAAETLQVGSGDYVFHDPATQFDLRVWYHRPKDFCSDSPVVVVMHGVKRNGDHYRDDWVEASEKHRFLLVVPDFRLEDYPHGRGYHFGNMLSADGELRPKSQWCIATLERIFDDVRQRTGSRVEKYSIYGHSAGAQLVHRMILFHPISRIDRAVAANAGWYTFPDEKVPYPGGIGHAKPKVDLAASFAVKLLILLGDQDNNPNHKYLPSSKAARAQGAHRFERGKNFFKAAQQVAESHSLPLAWQLQVVPGAVHKNALMVPAAAAYLTEASAPHEPAF